MIANRGRDTKPEIAVRRLVWALGMRYLVDSRPVPSFGRRADIVFRGPKVAVFIDGCFWHGCPNHYRRPKRNSAYWEAKIARNRDRDAETTRVLAKLGWQVLRFWEHEDAVVIATRIEAAIRAHK